MDSEIITITSDNDTTTRSSTDKSVTLTSHEVIRIFLSLFIYREQTYATQNYSSEFIYGSILFTCISMIIGITVVSLNAPDNTSQL